MNKPSPFRYFKTSPEIIRLVVMMYVWFPLSLRNVEDLMHGGYSNPDTVDPLQAYCIRVLRKVESAFGCSENRIRCTST